MKAVIVDRADFVYGAQLEPIGSPSGHFNLRVSSVWRQAKDPDAERVKLDVLLDRAGLEALRNLIENALEQ